MWPITRSIAFRRFQLLFHLRRQPPFAAADQDLRRFQLVTTVAAINKSPLDRLPGDPLHLGDCTGQGVAVAGIARLGLHAHDTVVAVGHRSTCNGHLDPKLELLVRLAFADAFHLGCVQAVELVLSCRCWSSKRLPKSSSAENAACKSALPLIFRTISRYTRPRKTFSRLISRRVRFAWRA